MRSLFQILILTTLALPLAVKAANDDSYPAGDVFFLQALHGADEVMRAEDFKNFYPELKHLSQMKFRVIMNWAADYQSLEKALQNKRPTIIIWSSHGDAKSFHQEIDRGDGSSVERLNEIPFNAFKNPSKSVYQVILSTCMGEQALKNYDLSGTEHVEFSYWNVSLSTNMFKEFLNNWDPLSNHPHLKSKENFRCKLDLENQKYKIFSKDNNNLSDGDYASEDDCFDYLMSSREGFMCVKSKSSTMGLSLLDTANRIVLKDSLFYSEEDCLQRPAVAKKSKICILDNNYHIQIYDAKIPGVLTPFIQSNRLVDCYNSILN